MRILSLLIGAVLLIGGGAAVVIADQQRESALDHARDDMVRAEQRLRDAQSRNTALAEELTGLRSTIAEQDQELSDTEGFLK